jgi:hypothetical protein
MTQDEIEEMAELSGLYLYKTNEELIYCLTYFAKLVTAKEREALEVELLKMKQGVVANSDYIQGRWDLIGEFQDIIRARRQ